MSLRPRHLHARLAHLLDLSPAVLLTGGRQVGKSTLVRQLIDEEIFPGRYLTLDTLTVRGAASADPPGFLAGLGGRVALDEVQRSPELLLAVKAEIDRDRRPGRFLLTGSANPLSVPRIADALVGRVVASTLWPYSTAEILGQPALLVDALLDARVPTRTPCWSCGFPISTPEACPLGHPVEPGGGAILVEWILRGGFPEIVERRLDTADRRDWFEAYLATLLQRTVHDLASVDAAPELHRLLTVVATESTGPVNYANLSNRTDIRQTTLKRYLRLLESVFLVRRFPAWTRSRSRRHVRQPKLHLTDTGVMAHLLNVDATTIERDRGVLGPLVETFVAMEIVKLASASEHRPTIHHFRVHDGGREVDLVLEGPGSEIVGIEVKAAASVRSDDFRGMRALQKDAGDAFRLGVVVYTGQDIVPFGPRLFALPASVLWASPDCFPAA